MLTEANVPPRIAASIWIIRTATGYAEPIRGSAIASSNQLLNESIAGDGCRECSDVIQ
jgi:hypothetical protein